MSREGCILAYSGIIDGSACVSRDEWIRFDSRNFVDINFEAQIYTEEINTIPDASVICRTKGGNVIEGVILYLGKFCTCPDSAPYFDSHDQKCKTAQQVNSDGNLTFDKLF